MNIRNVITYLLAILFMAGCRTSDLHNELNASSAKDTEENKRIYAEMIENVNQSIRAASTSWYQQIWNNNTQWQRSVYSEPDSNGNQYVQAVEMMNSVSEGKNERKDTVYVDYKYEALLQKMLEFDNHLNKVEQMISSSHFEKKAGITWYQAALQFLGICFLLYVAVKLLIKKIP